MTKFLDLRKKVEPRVKIIYKTVIERRPWHLELTKILAVVFIVGTVVWGITKADDTDSKRNNVPTEIETFGVMGIVSSVADTEFSLDKIGNKGENDTVSLAFDVKMLQKIETSGYEPLQFSDIRTGDKIIVQGTIEDGVTIARRVISFASTSVTTTPATSTEVLVSTSTGIFASSTASSTPSFIENVIETITETVQEVIGAITDAINGTTSESIASTTASDIATTTETVTIGENVATSTEASPTEQEVQPDVTATETGNNATSTE